MAPQKKNAAKASKLKSPKGGVQKPKQHGQNKKSAARPAKTASRATKKTASQPSVPASSPVNASNGQGKWVWTEHPPTKEQTAANGRQKGRSLVQWNRPDTAITLLLNTLYQASIQGHKLSMDAIAHRTHCGASGQSLIQHLARERRRILKRGRMAPPIAGSRFDPTVRGVVLEPTSDNPNAERNISFREPYYHQDFPVPEGEGEWNEETYLHLIFANDWKPQMSQEARGKRRNRPHSHDYTMTSPEIEFQEQHPQQFFCAPQNYQMPWNQPQSSPSAHLSTANPSDATQNFGSQVPETPQMFGQDPHKNGLGGSFNLLMPSMPNDNGMNAQQIAYDNMATRIHGLGRQKLEPPSSVYEHWPNEYDRLFGHYPGDLVSDTAPFAVDNPSASLFQDTSPPHGLCSNNSPFGDHGNGGGAMNDDNFGQWAQDQGMDCEPGVSYGL
ncbi:hypothetical protein LX32DRAFT_710813 [Colletotrichum zoysiae]|uniref:Uncharacterized protein n=1 Tax=Colletotrichum zoysiae TaxID=1216348 RepID=A0AAD9HNT7_9PEZI|nr:hypothetical protein LX32DRAFT_710813 [Colletotrichum zoysiae]